MNSLLRKSCLNFMATLIAATSATSCVQSGKATEPSFTTELSPCVPITSLTNRIRSPGKYCLQESITARMDLPDRRSESMLLWIQASDVEIDMNGKTIGRRTGIFGSVGGGIVIDESVKNLMIRNGYVQHLGVCIRRDANSAGGDVEFLQPQILGERDFDFPDLKISFRNVSINNCRDPFLIRVPRRK